MTLEKRFAEIKDGNWRVLEYPLQLQLKKFQCLPLYNNDTGIFNIISLNNKACIYSRNLVERLSYSYQTSAVLNMTEMLDSPDIKQLRNIHTEIAQKNITDVRTKDIKDLVTLLKVAHEMNEKQRKFLEVWVEYYDFHKKIKSEAFWGTLCIRSDPTILDDIRALQNKAKSLPIHAHYPMKSLLDYLNVMIEAHKFYTDNLKELNPYQPKSTLGFRKNSQSPAKHNVKVVEFIQDYKEHLERSLLLINGEIISVIGDLLFKLSETTVKYGITKHDHTIVEVDHLYDLSQEIQQKLGIKVVRPLEQRASQRLKLENLITIREIVSQFGTDQQKRKFNSTLPFRMSQNGSVPLLVNPIDIDSETTGNAPKSFDNNQGISFPHQTQSGKEIELQQIAALEPNIGPVIVQQPQRNLDMRNRNELPQNINPTIILSSRDLKNHYINLKTHLNTRKDHYQNLFSTFVDAIIFYLGKNTSTIINTKHPKHGDRVLCLIQGYNAVCNGLLENNIIPLLSHLNTATTAYISKPTKANSARFRLFQNESNFEATYNFIIKEASLESSTVITAKDKALVDLRREYDEYKSAATEQSSILNTKFIDQQQQYNRGL